MCSMCMLLCTLNMCCYPVYFRIHMYFLIHVRDPLEPISVQARSCDYDTNADHMPCEYAYDFGSDTDSSVDWHSNTSRSLIESQSTHKYIM